MTARDGRAPSQRQLRIGEELRHALAHIFERGEFRDPVLASHVITVTEVRTGRDMRNATVYVVPLAGQDIDAVVEALNRATSYLRHQLSQAVHIRHVPRLQFRYDHSFDTASHIDDLLHDPRVAQDLRNPSNDEPSDSGPSDPEHEDG